jgi:hypothetical protein
MEHLAGKAKCNRSLCESNEQQSGDEIRPGFGGGLPTCPGIILCWMNTKIYPWMTSW